MSHADAIERLRLLVEALQDAHISSWQSTAKWQKELDAAAEYLQNAGATPLPRDENDDSLRAKFEKICGFDSFGLKRSRRGTYVNPAKARDWKMFLAGYDAARPANDFLDALTGGGWKVEHSPPSSLMTDEFNTEHAFVVTRVIPPYCDSKGQRAWTGPTPEIALQRARKELRL